MQAFFGSGDGHYCAPDPCSSLSPRASRAADGVGADWEGLQGAPAASPSTAGREGKSSLQTARAGLDALTRDELLKHARMMQKSLSETQLENKALQKRLDLLTGGTPTGGTCQAKNGIGTANVRTFGKLLYDAMINVRDGFKLQTPLFRLALVNCLGRDKLLVRDVYTVASDHPAYLLNLVHVMQPTVHLITKKLSEPARMAQFQNNARVSDTGMSLLRNLVSKQLNTSVTPEQFSAPDSHWGSLKLHEALEAAPGLPMPVICSERQLKNLRKMTRLGVGLCETGDGAGNDYCTLSYDHIKSEMTKAAQAVKKTTIMENDGTSREVLLIVNFQDGGRHNKSEMQVS
jgi:hypothetical protein